MSSIDPAFNTSSDAIAADRDSLAVLPLNGLPLEHPTVRRGKLIKNARLETAIEYFNDREAGSGQRDVEGIGKEYGWHSDPPHPDLIVLRRLHLLRSFDVYTLRISFREMGIEVTDASALKLSASKVSELTAYMSHFTRPLLAEVYGSSSKEFDSLNSLLAAFSDPDVEKARKRLSLLSEKLGIAISAIPRFLEDYGDIFLSLSYYRNCLDRIEPVIKDFLDCLQDLRKSFQLRRNPVFMSTAASLEATFTDTLLKTTGRFESFERNTLDMWRNLDAERFRKLERLIRAHHTTVGGVLCALTVKMNAWERLFPRKDRGGPVKRAEFIMSDMKHGLSVIKKIEAAAPQISDF